MPGVIEVRDGEVRFDLIESATVPEVFADGISQVMIGFPCSKLVFHSVVAPALGEDAVEQRRAVMRLTVGSDTLAELCRKVLTILERDGADMEAAAESFFERMRGGADGSQSDEA